MRDTLLILDTFNFLHRAYHALPNTFRDLNGEPTNAVYGVTSMVINVLDKFKPQYCVAALDGPDPTFRVEDFTGYKAHRKPMDTDLSSQIPKVFEVLDSFGIKRIVVPGYEADDVIGTLVKRYSDEVDIVIVSNDKDLWQLINGHVKIMVPGKKGAIEYLDREAAIEKLGFIPEKIADYKGLRGDPSDNIPGVYGVGDKTAKKLLGQFENMEGIYKNIETVKPDSLKEKLLNSYEQALMSKKLAEIILDVPFEMKIDEAKYSQFSKLDVKEVLEKYNFKSLIRRLGLGEEVTKSKTQEVDKNQLGLF